MNSACTCGLRVFHLTLHGGRRGTLIVCVFRVSADLVSKFDLRGASIVGQVSSSMWISSEGRTTYIYVKKNWRECKAYHRRWLRHYLFETSTASSTAPLSSPSFTSKCVDGQAEEVAVCRLQSTIQRAFSILLERQEELWRSTEEDEDAGGDRHAEGGGGDAVTSSTKNGSVGSDRETGRRAVDAPCVSPPRSASPPSSLRMATGQLSTVATPRARARSSGSAADLRHTEGEAERTGGRRRSLSRRSSQNSVGRRRPHSSVVNQSQRQIQIQQLYIQSLLRCCRHPGVLSSSLRLQQPLWEGEQASLDTGNEMVEKEVRKRGRTSNTQTADESEEANQLREAIKHFRSCYVRMSRW